MAFLFFEFLGLFNFFNVTLFFGKWSGYAIVKKTSDNSSITQFSLCQKIKSALEISTNPQWM